MMQNLDSHVRWLKEELKEVEKEKILDDLAHQIDSLIDKGYTQGDARVMVVNSVINI